MKWKVPMQWVSNGVIEVNADSAANALMVAAAKCTAATTPGHSATLVPGTMKINGMPVLIADTSQFRETICISSKTLTQIESALLWNSGDETEETILAQNTHGESYVFTAIFGDGCSMDISYVRSNDKPQITAILYNEVGKEIASQLEEGFWGRHTIKQGVTEYICDILLSAE